jgi:CHAT domain-containing protein
MANFYEHLGRHEGKAEALRQAQLEMLKTGTPPYYWAGFQLDGEPSDSLFKKTETTSSSRSIR